MWGGCSCCMCYLLCAACGRYSSLHTLSLSLYIYIYIYIYYIYIYIRYLDSRTTTKFAWVNHSRSLKGTQGNCIMAQKSCHEFVPGRYRRSIIKSWWQKIDTTRRLQSKNYYSLTNPPTQFPKIFPRK